MIPVFIRIDGMLVKLIYRIFNNINNITIFYRYYITIFELKYVRSI